MQFIQQIFSHAIWSNNTEGRRETVVFARLFALTGFYPVDYFTQKHANVIHNVSVRGVLNHLGILGKR